LDCIDFFSVIEPHVFFSERKYYFYEPSSEEHDTVVFVTVIRDGDVTTSSTVAIETRDGSAVSSLHYEPFAKVYIQ